MKPTFVLFFSSLLFSVAQDAPAPAEAKPAEPEKKAEIKKPQYLIDLENLTDEETRAYGEHFYRANTLFKQKRIFECLEELQELHNIYGKNPASLNLKGACYVEFRAFEKARIAFAKASKASPDNFNVRFNLAEIEFVSQNFEEALIQFETLLAEARETKKGGDMFPILEFKTFLCRLKTGNEKGAREILDTVSFLDDSPLFYYGNAALAYHADKGAKAEEWLARCSRIFRNPDLLAPWQDTLIEFGYIKSFYGGDLEVTDGAIPVAPVGE